LIPLDKKDRSRQSSIWVDGNEYLIQTDFHYWIGFDKKVRDLKNFSELDYLYKPPDYVRPKKKNWLERVCERIKLIFHKPVITDTPYIPENKEAAYKELEAFFINKQPLPRDTGETGKNTIDFDIDSERIYCAFLEKYNINLITTNLHWHDFQALYFNMFYPLDYVMGCRLYEKPKKKTEKQRESELETMNLQNRYRWELEPEKKEKFKMK
jgi:hypothetical protein